jgi:hypothetical protein
LTSFIIKNMSRKILHFCLWQYRNNISKRNLISLSDNQGYFRLLQCWYCDAQWNKRFYFTERNTGQHCNNRKYPWLSDNEIKFLFEMLFRYCHKQKCKIYVINRITTPAFQISNRFLSCNCMILSTNKGGQINVRVI